jgi:hypothetical protein
MANRRDVASLEASATGGRTEDGIDHRGAEKSVGVDRLGTHDHRESA